MSARLKLTVLLGVSVLQLGVTSSSILRYESTLRTGALHRIPTTAVDPADAFRGRYVAVRPTITILNPVPPATVEILQRIQSGETGYVVLGSDANGLAQAADVRLEPPSHSDYLRIASVWEAWRQDSQQPSAPSARVGFNVSFSFDRYYMNDVAAPQAQTRYAEAAQRRGEPRTWLAVRVKNGVGVIEGLYVDGIPIEQAIAATSK